MDYEIAAAQPGEEVTVFAAHILALARLKHKTVLGEFNQHTLEASPGMTLSDVLRPWDDAQRRSYFGTAASAEEAAK